MKDLLLSILFLSSCATVEVAPKKSYDLKKPLEVLDFLSSEVEVDSSGQSIQVQDDCDGMIWQGQWCAYAGCNLDNYEDDERRGKFYRRPEPRCWVPERENYKQPSASNWSRDMGACGLGIYGLVQKAKSAISRHVEYGRNNFWVMGEPLLADDIDPRVAYTPNMRAYFYRLSAHLGNTKYTGYHWPSTYPKGQTDYHAHLQLCSIFVRGETDGKVNSQMKARIDEHYKRDKTDLMAALLYARYSGDYDRIHSACSSNELILPSYVRCDKGTSQCKYAHKVFVCSQMIEDLSR